MKSPLEILPAEIIVNIFSHLGPYEPDKIAAPSKDILSCMLSSRAMYAVTIGSLFRHISIQHHTTFYELLTCLRQHPEKGSLVRRLDFSRYSNSGWGRSSSFQNLNPDTLLECLSFMPQLQEFLVQPQLEEEITESVLIRLVQISHMQALDFCACNWESFVEALTAVATATFSITSHIWLSQITRLSLHQCMVVPAPVFEALLPQLPHLTHLDLAHTNVTDDALAAIPHTARLSHLNLSRCTKITGGRTVEFLTSHSAIGSSLIVLNIMRDKNQPKLLDTQDCHALIPRLPRTLRSLNAGGADLDDSHIPALLPWGRILEELSVCDTRVSTNGLALIFGSPGHPEADQPWARNTLHYIDVSGVLESNDGSEYSSLNLLMAQQTAPLEVIEISETVLTTLNGSNWQADHPDWTTKKSGDRAWYVRQAHRSSSGARSWKMGSHWWGSRKISVAEVEAGGLQRLAEPASPQIYISKKKFPRTAPVDVYYTGYS